MPTWRKKPFYITTTLPYVNDRPHIGHALEGAILNCDWHDIGEARKREFKIFAKGLRGEMK